MPIKEAKFTSNNLFADKSKRIDFWVNNGIYEKEPHEQVELRVSLIEQLGSGIQEYPVKSTLRPISADHLAYEQRILDPISKSLPNNNGNTAINTTGNSDSALYAPSGELCDFYKILDINDASTSAQIEDAYIKQQTKWQAAMWHQERYKDIDITAKLGLATLARNVLINPERRAHYDSKLLGKTIIPADKSESKQIDTEPYNTPLPAAPIEVPEKLTFVGWLLKVLGR